MKRDYVSLAERTAEQLRERIRNQLQPGECLPALRKLGGELGVSINTLRAAISLLASEGRLESRHGEGVFVKALTEKARIGVLSELNLLMPVCTYHRALANEILCILRDRGMTPHLFCGAVQPGESPEQPTCPEFWEAADRHRLDGAIILNAPCNDPWYFRVEKMALPAVGEHTAYHVPHADVQAVDHGLRALARHGARRIALLTASPMLVRPLFEQGVVGLGMRTAPEWILGEINPALPGAGWEEFRQLWGRKTEKPDGLLVTDDLLFRGAAQAIRELGIAVPGRLRVAAHALRGADQPPPFPHTRIEFDPRDFALALMDLLERRLAGKRPPDTPPRVPHCMVEVAGELREQGLGVRG